MGSVANAVHREPRNKGKIVGQKAPFKLKDIWAGTILGSKLDTSRLRVCKQLYGACGGLACVNSQPVPQPVIVHQSPREVTTDASKSRPVERRLALASQTIGSASVRPSAASSSGST